jgi:hypothetical protein
MRTLLRSDWVPGESGEGYLLRIANKNGYGSLAIFAKAWGLPIAALLCSPIETLAVLLFSEADEFESARSEVSSLHQKREKYQSLAQTRFCPHCLRSDRTPYFRASWRHPISFVCLVHQCLLPGACECGRNVRFDRPSLLVCECGKSYCDGSTQIAQPWYTTFRWVFKEAFAENENTPLLRPSHLAYRAAGVCRWLANLSEERESKAWEFAGTPPYIGTAELDALAKYFVDWPVHTLSILAGEKRKSQECTYDHVSVKLEATKFSALKDIHNQLQEEFASINVRRRTGIKELMKVTGHGYTSLVSAIDRGVFGKASFQFDPARGVNKFSIGEDVLEQVRVVYAKTTDLKGAAERAGCSSEAIRGLIAAGFLVVWPIIELRPRVDLEVLGEFSHQILEWSKFKPISRVLPIFFSDWVTCIHSDAKIQRWVKIIGAIRLGKLTLYRCERKRESLNDLYFDRRELDSFFRDRAA